MLEITTKILDIVERGPIESLLSSEMNILIQKARDELQALIYEIEVYRMIKKRF